jgi:hypothetical protein
VLPGLTFIENEPLFALTVVNGITYHVPPLCDHLNSLIVLSAVQLTFAVVSFIDAVKVVIAAYLGMVVRAKFPLIVIVPGVINTPPEYPGEFVLKLAEKGTDFVPSALCVTVVEPLPNVTEVLKPIVTLVCVVFGDATPLTVA